MEPRNEVVTGSSEILKLDCSFQAVVRKGEYGGVYTAYGISVLGLGKWGFGGIWCLTTRRAARKGTRLVLNSVNSTSRMLDWVNSRAN